MRTFKIHFYDGNQICHRGNDIDQVLKYMSYRSDIKYTVGMITKIEEIKDFNYDKKGEEDEGFFY